MALVNLIQSRSLERWSPTLFLVAGPMVLVVVAIEAVRWFTSVGIPEIAYWPLYPVGVALALAGVVGLYPRLPNRDRGTATVGLVLGVVGVIALLGGTVALLAVRPPGPYPRNLGPFGVPFLLGLVAFVPAVGACAVAGLRTATPSRRVGGLLLILSLGQGLELVAALFVFPVAGASPGVYYFVFEILVYSALATVMVAVGYSLRTDSPPTADTETVGATA